MHRTVILTAWLVAAIPLSAAEPAPAEPTSTSWYQRTFGSKPAPAPAPVPAPAPAEKPPTWSDVSRSLDQERAVYMERLQFCTRLRQIAFESGDEELRKKAEMLEEQAEQVFVKRTSKLPTIVQDVRAAEANLEQRKPGPPAGSASASAAPSRIAGRQPNGRPVRE